MNEARGRGAAMREDADVVTSSDEYALRFAGRVGAWFLDVQAAATLDLLRAWPKSRVLDVGGGHGQTLPGLSGAGHRVTVFGSATSCAARIRPWLARGEAAFLSGDVLRLPFPDGAFDVAMSYRLLPHVTRWRELIAELARVARRGVVVDYPTRRSVNVVSDSLFGLKQRVEGDTRPYTVFGEGEMRAAFAACGLRVTGRRPQFVLPMALHRALRLAPLSRALEGVARALFLTRAFGSPVIVRAER